MKNAVIETLEDLRALAGAVLADLSLQEHTQIILLRGDLGAGKTAFVKELAREIGVVEEITSPTFVIMKSYHIPAHSRFKTLTHIDAYRIEDEDELRVIGFQELCEDPTRLVCIEWPEKIPASIPQGAYALSITLVGTTRTITYGTEN